MDLCNIDDIRAVLGRHGFRFSKSLGQNFLTAAWVPARIADSCGVDQTGCALEIGPGMGCLTEQLSQRAGKVCAIELDRALFPVLEETLAHCDNIEIVQGDVLKCDLAAICREKFGDAPVYACANLPYYITTPAISALLASKSFQAITVMVQKEVAERICAPAGTAAYSAFSIYIDYYADAEILFDVPRNCFVPQPKVDSAVVRLTPRSTPPVPVCDEKLFFSLVKAAFGQRRKTLANALSSVLGGSLGKEGIVQLITDCGFDARVRGEKLSLADYAALTELAHQRLDK
ncbi:16S rRNA (adenine(1518)-N(6)/adenine(1519)-N(6))-dimethyltransferase RsmA [Butyricicoccus porcorum]|uniref:Ribosomal RNA small subunit methyltransferase A n=1 Tax=Butyricicoccus porcorum TaxID=1945634 RepID=A0A252F2Q9_9FIRM|nr:16S rRNA (adenine(1518)-N(6)/adenine(1519)-N(6))-dimethyltransferase RsmA [Butyricicoccus porcorum]MDD6986069.1 16S rRNA (adenine(1518)-N(6)/adenine(1519)-N(6))-dimethyltransferase RsmA [Butyricicoccus porcorum]OUM20077.1 16S rRNA (adenine(1518)-N(6)/adenine(1519)-N(6))-dimethyltransferase [Butyricicoccus porcorum]